MSICIEQNHQNNFSQSLSTCESQKAFSYSEISRRIKLWIDRSRQRKHLARLDDHLLSDIGYTREQVQVEISKPFWK